MSPQRSGEMNMKSRISAFFIIFSIILCGNMNGVHAAECIPDEEECVCECDREQCECEEPESEIDDNEIGHTYVTDNIEVGDTYMFGSYEQDNDLSNGTEEIEWIVLEKKESSLMLISKYGLDSQEYTETAVNMTWETCSLRGWLNKEFLNAAFSADEQKRILVSDVTADKSTEEFAYQGNSTKDKVYLMSFSEYHEYPLPPKCVPTAYAIAQGAAELKADKADDGENYCIWMLRTMGWMNLNVVVVSDDGVYFANDYLGVRPTIQISCDPSEKIQEGDIYKFGNYEQDNNTSDGKEEIEWFVVKKNTESMVLVSKYALDCKPFNKTSTNVLWENCDLRSWMNTDFYNNAFSCDEQKMIETIRIVNDVYPDSITEDRVFLLTSDEVGRYLEKSKERICVPTAYTIAQNNGDTDKTKDGNYSCTWWLRTPGISSSPADVVFSNGKIGADVGTSAYSHHVVRPVLWIRLSAGNTCEE